MKVRANGIAIEYDLTGDGEAVTLIHALGLDRQSWWRQVPMLEADHRVLRYDVRGHGQTDKPAGPYSVALFAEDLRALLTGLRIGKTRVVGLSMGGMIAQAFALNYPEMVTSLVLCDTSSGHTEAQRQTFYERAQLVEREGMEPLVAATLERWLTPPFRTANPEIGERIAQTLRRNDPRGYAASCRAVGDLALTERLGQITCPTLVVVGEKDAGTPPEMARVIQARIPDARLEVIPAAAHLVPVEKADRFNALLREFFSRTP
ncbi:MAG: alpha/beta fold hydrolase [Chloroflexota bacterium]